MSLEDDICATILDVRDEHKRRQEESARFEKRWSAVRQEFLGPALGDVIAALERLDRKGKKDFSNGSISLVVGVKVEGEINPLWKCQLTFSPSEPQKEMTATFSTSKRQERVPLEKVDRAAVDRLLVEFIREAEEQLISGK